MARFMLGICTSDFHWGTLKVFLSLLEDRFLEKRLLMLRSGLWPGAHI
jgi:hypothetical protein